MMSVNEYALDVNLDIKVILKLCHDLSINVSNGNDILNEDDIILLDGEIDKLQTEKDVEEEEFLAMEEYGKLRIDDKNDSMKPKEVLAKQKKDSGSKSKSKANDKYLKDKKKMYKNKEKLKQNEENLSNVIIYKNDMSVKDLAEALFVTPKEIIKKLFDLGLIVNINQSIDYDTALLIALDYNKEVKKEETRDIVNFEEYEIIDDEKDLVQRPAIVTIMGHVDHGKTSLLDVIRKTNVVSGEAGGITQAIGAYQVKVNDKPITFIDTPGHEAFTQMRARGASVTDIVVLIVSATDGVKPQTKEAIDHAQAANVPIIVAINKMDLKEANPDRVMQELSEYGLTPDSWGGDTLYNKISCVTKEGISDLLDNILLVADMLELKANPNRYATGTVIESRLDKNIGNVCSLLIQNGTLRIGDPIVVGNFHGKVRTLKNDLGENITFALPSTPVEITGLSELPTAGDHFMAFETEKEARRISDLRTIRHKEANTNRNGMSLDDLFNKVQEGIKSINVVLKTDVKGSEEAIKSSLSKINVEGVKVSVIRSGVGAITESDVVLANASNAIIYGFNVRPNNKIIDYAKEYNVEIRLHNVIYKIIEEIEQAIVGMLEPIYEEKSLGNAEIRQIFKFSKVGNIAGSHVIDGVIKQNEKARLIRDGIVVYEGKIASLQREKEKVNEVKKGMDCGITLENFIDIKENDIINCYELVEVKR